MQSSKGSLLAGAATADLTPQSSVFLFGYPHVARMSTGVHDRLEAAALYLHSGSESVLFIANDLIFIGRDLALDVRRRISARTGIPGESIILTATHTHSGPVMVDYASNAADPVVPKADRDYLRWVAGSLVEAGCAAVRAAVPAEAGLVVADGRGVGTNRHNPAGPADTSVPVLMVRCTRDQRLLACMVTYAMHTTVLHEDSTLISGDFPHFTRQYLRAQGLVPAACPILYHNGASGNQSPRHVTTANTFAEAQRLGEMLGAAIAKVLPAISYSTELPLAVRSARVPLVPRKLPAVAAARTFAHDAKERFEKLKRDQAPRTAVRTAECDWFGAEETVALAVASEDGSLARALASCNPAEIHVVTLGRWKFVCWPGEFFVEYALAVKAASADTFVITMANGELQGYIVTPEAVAAGVYEATNAVFDADNGRRVVEATLALLAAKG